MLDSAARVTRELSVPPPSIMASMPVASMPMASMPIRDAAPAAPVASVEVAATLPTPPPAAPTALTPAHAPAPRLARTPAPATAPPTAPASTPPSTMGASTTAAPPELVLKSPSAKVTLVGDAPALSPLPTPRIELPARVATVAHVPAADSEVEAPPAPAPPAPAPPVPAPTGAAPVVTPVRDTIVAPHADVPSDKLIRTPLGPFTIPGALLSDRDKEAQYCYTQLGLKYSPDLKGEITVKLSLRADGGVDEAVVTKRSWQGISAGEVESCVRALAHDWTFASSDPSVTNGAKSLTFSFTP
jgi:hypothetical protein